MRKRHLRNTENEGVAIHNKIWTDGQHALSVWFRWESCLQGGRHWKVCQYRAWELPDVGCTEAGSISTTRSQFPLFIWNQRCHSSSTQVHRECSIREGGAAPGPSGLTVKHTRFVCISPPIADASRPCSPSADGSESSFDSSLSPLMELERTTPYHANPCWIRPVARRSKVFLFVRLLHGRPSQYLWEESECVVHGIAQGEREKKNKGILSCPFSTTCGTEAVKTTIAKRGALGISQ